MSITASTLLLDPITVPIREEADGSLRVGNSRVVLELVLESFRDGGSPEEIVQAFQTLNLPDVYAVAAWYLRNRETADAWLAECELEAEELQQKIEATRGIPKDIRDRLLARSRAGSKPC